MKIEWLKLENFHGFEKKEITFHPQFTVLVGDNASGKTAVLEGVSVAIGAYANPWTVDPADLRGIDLEEVRLKRYLHGQIPTLEPQFPAIVTFGTVIEGDDMQISRIKENSTDRLNGNNMVKLLKFIHDHLNQVRSGQQVELPIFAFFKTSRLWSQSDTPSTSQHTPGSRFEGYRNYLNPNTNESEFVKWFIQMSLAEIKLGEPVKVLNSVRKAIINCMHKLGVTKIDYDPLRDEIQVFLGDDEQIPFRLLSDGYRNTMGLVADIAHRMAVLNPFMEDHLQTSGIVLIDELDLHLHPKWQRHIVNDLKSTFPNVQFIVTTHSPFVVQSLEQGELRVLDENTVAEDISPATYVNKSVEDVSEHVMGVEKPQRSEKLQQLYEETKHYYLLIDSLRDTKEADQREQLEKEIAQTKQKIDELDSLFSDNVAFHAILELERLRLLGGAKHETD